MRAVRYEQFGGAIEVIEVPTPDPPTHGVVVKVSASGLCRSDWHGWLGHDPDITLPHIPGHELSGVISSVGADVRKWHGGERVTTPFACGCGTCAACQRGDAQVCDRQTQPGFSHDGSFADYVVVHHADFNVVGLPEDLDDVAAVSLGCRFATAYRAVVAHGEVGDGDWVAVHGCGGVGLSAIMIAVSRGARVIAVDISADARALAVRLGAQVALDPLDVSIEDAEGQAVAVGEAVHGLSGGGVRVSIDALGSTATSLGSVYSLQRRGRHVQVGLLPASVDAPIYPMESIIFGELEIRGSHGMAAHAYPALMAEVASGRLDPTVLVTRRISLNDVPAALMGMDDPRAAGITVAVLDGGPQ